MNCPEICPCMEVYLDDKSFAQNHTDFRFLFRSSPVHSDPNISSIFFSAVSMDSSSNKSYPMPASSLPTAPFFLTNSSSSSYRDLSLVLGIQRKEKSAPTREVAADRNITPLMPRLLTRTGNAYNGETYLFTRVLLSLPPSSALVQTWFGIFGTSQHQDFYFSA